jgi:hypothetical protein
MVQYVLLMAAVMPGQMEAKGGLADDPMQVLSLLALPSERAAQAPRPRVDDLPGGLDDLSASTRSAKPSGDWEVVPDPVQTAAEPPAEPLFETTRFLPEPPPAAATPAPLEISAPFLPAPTPAATPAPPGVVTVLPDRWWLMRQAQGTWMGALMDDNRLYLTGWLQQSFTASTDRVSNVTVVWNDRANEYLFQQGWIRLGRSVVTSGTTQPTFGFQIDILTGSDYRFTLPRGLWNSQLFNTTGAQNLYGVDPIQHYVSMFLPTLFRGVEFRLGRLYTPWGVESLEGVSNPLLSRSYAFTWSPPFTHCGLGAYVTFTPEWSGVFMLANGNDVYFGDPSEELRFLGNIRYVQPGGRNTVTVATSLGRGKFNPSFATPPNQSTVALATEPFGRNNFNAFDVVYTHLFSSVLSYNLEAIYGYQYNVPQAALALGSRNGFANWYSAAHYLFWTITPRWSSVIRYENFVDAQGQRTGFAGLYTAITGGVQYRINKSMIVRPELRFDNNALQRPYEGKHSIFTAASDLIIRW